MILIVEHDPAQAELLSSALTRAGLAHALARDAPELESRLDDRRADADTPRLALIDLDMPGLDALAFIRRLRRERPELPILAHSAAASVSRAVAAIRAGAEDLLLKPVAAPRLEKAIRGALARGGDAAQAERRAETRKRGFAALVARSPAIRKAVALAERAAGSDAPLLLEGESGVGKEVFARAVHCASRRAEGPFVAVNCGALPEALVESILFGHDRGAFTGAVESRPGKFAEADGGVLFLDEVGELSPPAQVKLLRALQERVIDPVGARRSRPVDIRVISASNRDLRLELAERRFREDLFYRLSVLPIRIPPLRARREDIGPLAENAARRIAEAEGRPVPAFSAEAMAALERADWPGNVRQLENAVHRAMVLAGGAALEPGHLFDPADLDAVDGARAAAPPQSAQSQSAPPQSAQPRPEAPRSEAPLGETVLTDHIRPLAEIEAEHIRRALARYDGRIAETARRLGIGRSTLYRKIEELGLAQRVPEFSRRGSGP